MRHHPTQYGLSQFLILVLLAITSGAAQVASAQSSSLLAPGDVVKITVYGNADLTTVQRVSPNGTISFPLVGLVALGGASTFDAERIIAEKLSRGGYVKNAAVSIFVQERSGLLTSSVTLLGHVVRSGTYSLDLESAEGVDTLIGLLAKAGGVTETAADHCFLIRKEKDQEHKLEVDLVELLRNGNFEANVLLRDGDILLVPAMDVFYIYGEVQRPGRYRLERGMTIMQGLSVASGMTTRGNAKGIVLNRQVSGSMQSLKSELEDSLQPNDVVYVRSTVF